MYYTILIICYDVLYNLYIVLRRRAMPLLISVLRCTHWDTTIGTRPFPQDSFDHLIHKYSQYIPRKHYKSL